MENNNTSKSIAVVVPTVRPEQYKTFVEAWKPWFDKYNVTFVTVWDGDEPTVTFSNETKTVEEVMGDDADLIYNKSDVVRNLGFAYVAKFHPYITHVLTLDDDVLPDGDTIGKHLAVLGKRVPVTWMSTANRYMRGFPYKVRSEAEVVLSHGVWRGVADWDAPTQLINGNQPASFYTGVIPKSVMYPMCGMNIMFNASILPIMYFAPMGHRTDYDRFGDIWLGITSKKIIDEAGLAVVTGYSSVIHNRASDVWANLRKEAPGLEINEDFWEGTVSNDYTKMYHSKRTRYREFMENVMNKKEE